jgi:hypothetical protein
MPVWDSCKLCRLSGFVICSLCSDISKVFLTDRLTDLRLQWFLSLKRQTLHSINNSSSSRQFLRPRHPFSCVCQDFHRLLTKTHRRRRRRRQHHHHRIPDIGQQRRYLPDRNAIGLLCPLTPSSLSSFLPPPLPTLWLAYARQRRRQWLSPSPSQLADPPTDQRPT